MDYVEKYLNELKDDGRKPGTLRVTKIILNRFQDCVGNKSLIEIDKLDIDRFVNELSKTNNQRSTSEIIQKVKRFYEYLLEEEIIIKNPLKIKAKRLQNGTMPMTTRPSRSFDEVKNFVHGVSNIRDQAMIVLFLKTLVRNGELCALTLDDIDEERRLLNVDKRFDEASKEILPGRKNGNTTQIPLDEETTRILKRYLKTRQKSKDNSLFLTYKKEGMGTDTPYQVFTGWSEKLNLSNNGGKYSKAITPHWARAWGGLQLEKCGISESVIDYIRGDKPSSTRGRYSRAVLDIEDVKEQYISKIFKFGL